MKWQICAPRLSLSSLTRSQNAQFLFSQWEHRAPRKISFQNYAHEGVSPAWMKPWSLSCATSGVAVSH